MTERQVRFRVGVVVAASLLGAGFLVAMFGELPTLVHGDYPLQVLFKQAPGVNQDTPVRKSGILVGRVEKVEFAKEPDGRESTDVLVTISMQGDKHIYTDEFCRVQSSLLGDSSLEFVRRPDDATAPKQIAPGTQLRGVYTPDPTQVMSNLEGGLQNTIKSVTTTSESLTEAAGRLSGTLDRVNRILDDNRDSLNSAIQEAGSTLREVRQTAQAARGFLGDEEMQQDVRESLKRFPKLIDDTQAAIHGIQETMSTMNRNLQNVEQVTQSLSQSDLADNLNRSAANLDRLLNNMADFSAELQNPNGSLNRLVSDPELYQNLNRAARNVDQLTRQMRPIVDDARVFSDKVSRNPGVIIRDAVHPGPGIK